MDTKNKNNVLPRLGDNPERMQTIINLSGKTSQEDINDYFGFLNRLAITAEFIEEWADKKHVLFNARNFTVQLDVNANDKTLATEFLATVKQIVKPMKYDGDNFLNIKKNDGSVVGDFEYKI